MFEALFYEANDLLKRQYLHPECRWRRVYVPVHDEGLGEMDMWLLALGLNASARLAHKSTECQVLYDDSFIPWHLKRMINKSR